ncbi:MAG: LacI family DNA-binding transcriptional regulator [Candidatus Methylacidiphilales bacterium]|nr:LacI family DNA-binding transcriptional regulator [Candidatus Methylacidiphilales bacterium]
MNPRVRLVDVARQAGVSLAAASMALHEPPRGISAATAAKVRTAAKTLGYVPDSAARALSIQSSVQRTPFRGTVAYLINHSGHAGRLTIEAQTSDHPEGSNLKSHLRELGYHMEGYVLPGTQKEADQLARILYQKGTVELLVDFYNWHYEIRFPWEDYAVVASSPHPLQARFDSVIAHSYSDVILAVRECRRRSYNRIGLAVSSKWFPDWKMGFAYASECFGGTLADKPLFLDDWNIDQFLRWYDKAKPDAVIANEGSRLPEDLAARGIHVSEDLGYCCLHVPPHRQRPDRDSSEER